MIDLFLKNIATSYFNGDFLSLERKIRQLLHICPFPILEISPNVPIQRLRNNYHGELFTAEAEISFRQDPWNIRDFGRANLPYSSKFYGSLRSKYIDEIRVVNVLETNKEFRERRMIKKKQVFTSGEWLTVRPLNVAIFPFDRKAIINNDEIKIHSKIYDNIIGEYTCEQQLIYKKVLKFLSQYYSLRSTFNHFDYAISAFISELLMEKYNLDGILYPSVRAQYKTYNIVLQPYSVLSKMRLENAAMFELFLNRKTAFIDNVAFANISTDLRLGWNYTERTPEWQLKHIL